MMTQYKTLSRSELKKVSGGAIPAIVGFVGGAIYDYLAGKGTASCQKNPNQWYCVNFN